MEILGDIYMKLIGLLEKPPLGCSKTLFYGTIALLLMATTFGYQRYPAPGCRNTGAGFPFAFACNYSGGGSPISSANRIDMADFPFFSPVGLLLNFIIYFSIVWLIALLITTIARIKK